MPKAFLRVLQKYTNANGKAQVLQVARRYKISIGVFNLLHKLAFCIDGFTDYWTI